MQLSQHANMFATLPSKGRIWAIAAIHGEASRLAGLHGLILQRFQPSDCLVYLGNYVGGGEQVLATLDELLLFRREILSLPGMEADDIVYLRGAQEEIWRKLLQIQMASDPRAVFQWMMKQGLNSTLRAYGGTPEEFEVCCREGVMALTRWTGSLRQAIRKHAGHDELLTELRRAAYTQDKGLLFTHAGVDPSRPFTEQNDSFWWGNGYFMNMMEPFDKFRLVISGFDRTGQGVRIGPYSATIDGNAGRGGKLIAACFSQIGQAMDWLEA